MLLRCYLIHITIIILRYILHLVYLCPSLGLSLFMTYLSDLFFIFSLTFTVINRITSLKQTHLFFVHFLEYLLLFSDDNVDEESEKFSNSQCSPSGCSWAFAWFFANFSLALLMTFTLITTKHWKLTKWLREAMVIITLFYKEGREIAEVRCCKMSTQWLIRNSNKTLPSLDKVWYC